MNLFQDVFCRNFWICHVNVEISGLNFIWIQDGILYLNFEIRETRNRNLLSEPLLPPFPFHKL